MISEEEVRQIVKSASAEIEEKLVKVNCEQFIGRVCGICQAPEGERPHWKNTSHVSRTIYSYGFNKERIVDQEKTLENERYLIEDEEELREKLKEYEQHARDGTWKEYCVKQREKHGRYWFDYNLEDALERTRDRFLETSAKLREETYVEYVSAHIGAYAVDMGFPQILCKPTCYNRMQANKHRVIPEVLDDLRVRAIASRIESLASDMIKQAKENTNGDTADHH